jgi:photosystem II stability/assembly factor-like uncharacterized protein
MKRDLKDRGGREPAFERRLDARTRVFAWLSRAQGAAEADKRGLKMTAVFGLRTGALALCLAIAARAQPVPDTTRRADSVTAWNDRCSLSIHGATVRWAVGDSGKVLKMVNGDTSAGYVIGRGQFDLCSVSFSDPDHGWIVGNKREDPERGRGVIFRTAAGGDGSQAWTASCPVIRPDINVPFLKVQALDVRHVWVTCGDGHVLYSNDGGTRWAVTAKRSGAGESGAIGSNHAK